MTATPMRRTSVQSGGLELAVWQCPPAGPTIVFVHGFPDTHIVWDRVIARLSARFRCIAYDVRGAGAAGIPATRDGYRMTCLVADLVSVMDAVSPVAAVHLVGHGGGSVQAWDAVVRASSDPRLGGRIASYTTISGPRLQHVGAFARSAPPSCGWGRRGEVVDQLFRSWYVYAFHIRRLPELALRRHYRRLLSSRGDSAPPFADTVAEDAGHWAPRSRPDEIASCIADFVASHPG